MVETTNMEFSDNQRHNLKDRVVGGGGEDATPIKGRVKIYEKLVGDNKLHLLEDTSNLIVYRGRNWLMQRAFDTAMTNRTGWNSKFISWFGVGTGGAVVGSPLTPTTPDLADCLLSTHGIIGAGSNYVTVDGKDYHKFDTNYPIFLNDPDVVNDDLCTGCTAVDPLDSQTYRCDKYLISMTKTTITSAECNSTEGSPALEYQDINEAGLFVSPSSSTGYGFASTDMDIFARVTFSTIRKDENRELIFSWYVYF